MSVSMLEELSGKLYSFETVNCIGSILCIGSLSVSLSEELSGKWYSFETGEHGDMLDLIIKTKVGFIKKVL